MNTVVLPRKIILHVSEDLIHEGPDSRQPHDLVATIKRILPLSMISVAVDHGYVFEGDPTVEIWLVLGQRPHDLKVVALLESTAPPEDTDTGIDDLTQGLRLTAERLTRAIAQTADLPSLTYDVEVASLLGNFIIDA